MYFAFLRIPLPRWVKALLALAVSGFAIEIIGNWQGSLSAAWDYLSSLPEMLLLSVVIPALLLIHFRRGNREARILLIFALVLSPEVWIRFLTGLLSLVPAFAPTGQRVDRLFWAIHTGPFTWNIDNIAHLLLVLSWAIPHRSAYHTDQSSTNLP